MLACCESGCFMLACRESGCFMLLAIIQRAVFVIFQIYLSCNKKLEKVLGDSLAPVRKGTEKRGQATIY